MDYVYWRKQDELCSGTFGRLMRQYRKRRKMNIPTFQGRTGLTLRMISRLERGLVKPPELPCLVNLIQGLGLEKDSEELRQFVSAAFQERYGHATMVEFREQLSTGRVA